MRYLRLLGSLARFTLARELSFRGNFLVKISVELIWLGIILAFYDVVFAKTTLVATWPRYQYMFFVGCFFALNGVIETLFMENCNEFAELIRTGDLDFLLLKPIDEQFLITCRRVDWATGLNFFMGTAVMLPHCISDGLGVRSASSIRVRRPLHLRNGDRLRLHGHYDVVVGLAGAQSIVDGNVVALFHPRAICANYSKRSCGLSRSAWFSPSSCRF